MSGKAGMGVYETPAMMRRWLDMVGTNRICARCEHSCKQQACVELVMCKRFRRQAAPDGKKG